MLGLRVDLDPSTRILTGGTMSNMKSSRFSERNIGRFHTSGVSGSMKKFEKLKLQNSTHNPEEQSGEIKRLKKYLPEKLNQRQKEIEEDTKQLLELEAKLEEIKTQKRLKKEREEARARQRMEYLSATKIQALYRSHLSRRRNQAVTIIISVLKSQANYNALTAAFWAARKITRFSAKVGRDYRLRRRRQAIIRYLTTSTWLSIKSTAIDNTIFRASLARNMVNRILSVGVRAIALCIVTARQQKEKVAHSKPNRSYSRGNSLKSPMAPKKTTKAAPRMKFHLTAFRRKISFCHSWYNPATEKDYSAQAMTEGLMSNKFHHYSHEDHLLHSVLEIEKKNQKSSLRTVNIDFVCPEEDERLKRLALLHKQKEEQMEIERQRRLQYIEEQKRIREHEAQLKAENELKERQRLEQMKQEFIERIQATQAERAKIMKQKREEKERIRQARDEFLRHEREKEKNEIKLMYAEDTRREENLEKQRKKILQFGQQMTQINEKIKRPHSASSSGVRKKLMSHLQREDILADGEVEEEKVTEMKKPELPKVPKVIKKVPPPLSKEEEERLRLEKEEQERERIRQQELREIALKKRLAAKLAQDREEKEKAALAEEAKKKEQELLLAKASLIIKKDLQRKEVLIKEERKRVKAHVKKKLEKSSCGTSSADSSHFPHPSGPSARTGGSAPSESEGAWKGLLDPLDSSYVARNGKQVNEKAVDWDWNDGTDYISPSHGKSLLHENEEDEKPLIKGDLNHEYLDTLQDCNEDYNFSENYLTNTHDSSLITPIIAIPSQEQAQSIFPPIDSAKSRGSKAPHVPLPSTDLAPSSLSVSFSQMISSHSRPNIPIGNIPVAVEKVLKRRKSNQIIQKENSKVEKVVSLAQMLLKAKEKISQDRHSMDPTAATAMSNPTATSTSNHSNSIQQELDQPTLASKPKKRIKSDQKHVPPAETTQSRIHFPKVPGVPSENLPSMRHHKEPESHPPHKITAKKEPKFHNSKKVSESKVKSQQTRKQEKKSALRDEEGNRGKGDEENDEDEDDASVVEKYFSMKRAQKSDQIEKLQIHSRDDDDEESTSPFQSNEYVPASPMFPIGDDHETFPLDLPPPSKNKSASIIDPTPLDLSYFNTDQRLLLDHKSHSIIEEDEEDGDAEDEDEKNDISYDKSNFVIHEDEEEEEEDENEEKKHNENMKVTSPLMMETDLYENDFEDGNDSLKDHQQLLSPQQSIHINQREDNVFDTEHSLLEAHEDENGDAGSEDSPSGKESSDDYERLLNLECENLRRKLEEKIMKSQMMGDYEEEEEEKEEEEEDGEEEGDVYGDDYEEDN